LALYILSVGHSPGAKKDINGGLVKLISVNRTVALRPTAYCICINTTRNSLVTNHRFVLLHIRLRPTWL